MVIEVSLNRIFFSVFDFFEHVYISDETTRNTLDETEIIIAISIHAYFKKKYIQGDSHIRVQTPRDDFIVHTAEKVVWKGSIRIPYPGNYRVSKPL